MSRKSAPAAKGMSFSAEEQAQLQKDFNEIARRLSELGEATMGTSAGPKMVPSTSTSMNSPFVSGLRGKTAIVETSDNIGDRSEDSGNPAEQKIKVLELILSKLTELDRIVLKKTAPETAPGNIAARRTSRGFDLFSLPTHLHIMDRLLDLHTQSKRVVTIRTTSDAAPGPPVADNGSNNQPSPHAKAIADKADSMNTEIGRLNKQLAESEEKRRAIQEDCSAARKEANAAKKELEAAKKSIEEHEKSSLSSNENERKLAALLAQEQQLNRELYEKVESAASTQESFINAILHRCTHEKNYSGDAAPSIPSSLPHEVSSSLRILDSTLSEKAALVREQLESLHSVKDSLESELYSTQTRCELMQKDLQSTTNELDAVKGAYSALEMEMAIRSSAVSQAALEKQLKLAESTIADLTSDLAKSHRRVFDLEKVADSVVDIEARLRVAEEAKFSLQTQLQGVQLESEAHRKLAESLRAKLKDLSSKSSEQDFLDSYEEVMRDEMMTMKQAFEGKLRAAKDEADAASRRNQELIRSLSTSASYEKLLAKR